MMVDGAEEGQLKGPIDVLAPYTRLYELFGLATYAPTAEVLGNTRPAPIYPC
jgi:hypothetical protein